MIVVSNAQRHTRVDLTALRRFAEAALAETLRAMPERNPNLGAIHQINVVLVSDRRIAELHRRFMNIAGATDVITFQHGDIFISVDTAARYAKEHASTAIAEIQLYLVHGILHLLGFDDRDADGATAMANEQEKICAAACKRLDELG
ncbi:hypothetical protein BH18VER1_BH18VER1_01640 [soil metagenome]